MVVNVASFKTFSIFDVFNGLPVALTIPVNATETATIGIANRDVSIKQTVLECPLKKVAIFLLQTALTVLLVLVPLSDIAVAIAPYQRALPFLVAFKESTRVAVTIGKGEDSLASTASFDVTSFVTVAILKGVDTTAMLAVITPITIIFVSMSIEVDAFA